MSATNQIYLVMDAGRLHGTARAASLFAAPARRIHQPARLYVLGQSGPVNHDHDGGAGRMIEVTDMGGRAPGVV
jgi:hypothetical protein